MTADDVLHHFQLQPLNKEGGFFVETYRSSEMTTSLPARYSDSRNYSTAIYYLLTSNARSKFHRLQSDEVWHFYRGDPVELIMLLDDGQSNRIELGAEWELARHPQAVVPRGTWQGARLIEGGQWALLGCTVAPGFDFADFELASREELLISHSKCAALIEMLT